MSSFVMTDCTAWIGGLALTTYSNELSVNTSVEDQDVTAFGGGGARSFIGGLRTTEANLSGFWESAVDAAGVTNLGVVNQACTFAANTTEGSAVAMAQLGAFSYERGGGVGDVNPFSLDMSGTDGVGAVHGLLAKSKGNVSATGALGSAVQLGAGAAGKYLYAVLHVFTAGTTISMKVESDDNSGFTTAADVASATMNLVTTTGGTWMGRVDASAFTDDWYRLNVTAITGTFNVGAALAIQ